MTTNPVGAVPEWTRGDRLRKARMTTGLTTREFADVVGVSQKTVTDAENDRRPTVRKILLNAWAMATGVPVAWLEHGEVASPPPVPPGEPGGAPTSE
jgi:transcriptional regulator with XRE-family HTH domain